jgi:hypothetical protein
VLGRVQSHTLQSALKATHIALCTHAADAEQGTLLDELTSILNATGALYGVQSHQASPGPATHAIDLSTATAACAYKMHPLLNQGVVHAAAIRELLLYELGAESGVRNVLRPLSTEIAAINVVRQCLAAPSRCCLHCFLSSCPRDWSCAPLSCPVYAGATAPHEVLSFDSLVLHLVLHDVTAVEG